MKCTISDEELQNEPVDYRQYLLQCSLLREAHNLDLYEPKDSLSKRRFRGKTLESMLDEAYRVEIYYLIDEEGYKEMMSLPKPLLTQCVKAIGD